MPDSWSKCWGKNTEVFRNSSASVNVLNLVKEKRCSWHRHMAKYNTFYLVSGSVAIKTEHGHYVLSPGMQFSVDPGTWHEFQVMEDSVLIEVMFVRYSPDDIERQNVGGDLSKGV